MNCGGEGGLGQECLLLGKGERKVYVIMCLCVCVFVWLGGGGGRGGGAQHV